jgi:type IV pilus assembly protein PilO
LKKTFVAKKTEALDLPLYRKQLEDIEKQFGALLKQLPGKSEIDALLTDINQAGLGRGLQFELFKPAADETVRDFYAELPISIRITGNYHDIGAFASDVGKLSRIVTLNDIGLTAGKDNTLIMDATAKTFRYLDDDELSAQRKAAAKDGKDKKGGK